MAEPPDDDTTDGRSGSVGPDDQSVGPVVAALVVAAVVLVGIAVVVVAGEVTLGGDGDADDDGLSDERERALDTDPEDPDTDGDVLPDGWEVTGEAPGGARLPDADPLHKDLYVQVNYGDRIPPLTDAERRQFRRAFAEMAVDNPDGRAGISLHLTDAGPRGGPLDQPVTVSGNVTRQRLVERFYTRDRLGERRCVYHQVVFGVIRNGTTVGYGETPGYLSVVEGTALLGRGGDASGRVRYAVHELLHNVVGHFDDGTSHTEEGWLTHESRSVGDDAVLSSRTRQRLDREGFATDRDCE